MSVGFLLASQDDAVIWRGPKKNGELQCTDIVASEAHPSRINQAVPEGCRLGHTGLSDR